MKVLPGLRLLLWKNWLLQRRHPIQSAIEIVAPVLFTALLVVVRSLVVPTVIADPVEYPSFTPGAIPPPPMFNINHTKYTVAWTPEHPGLREVILRAAWIAGFEEAVFEDEESLQSNLTSETGNSTVPMLGGVVFRGNFSGDEIPNDIEVRIRFPSIQKIVYIESNTWLTDRLYPDYQVTGPRTKDNEKGGPPHYAQKGWLGVQHAIGTALVEYLGDKDLQDVRVRMRRFPYPPYIDDPLLDAMKSFVSLTIMLSFVYICINSVRCVTTEKERQLKESMKIMGLPGWLHWSAWFLNFMSLLIIALVFMVLLMKVDWYGNEATVFTHTHFTVLFVFLFLYSLTTITFSFLISTCFSKANTAATIAGVAWFFSYAPYYFVEEAYSSLTLGSKLAACIAANTGMAFGCQIIVQFEGTGEGQQWHNIFTPASLNDNLTLGAIMIMFVVDAVVYMLVALYIEAVFPGEYGVPLPFYFPFQKSYWFPNYGDENRQPKLYDNMTRNSYFEEEPGNLPAGIQIINLHKTFDKKVAVKGLNLNMYEGHITALLGHNGAGKTTTMAMLTGLLTPSGGTALVGGCDIRRDINKARKSLGLCPQHNILFDELTVTEHLQFFCKVKGLSPEEEQLEVAKYIKLLNFESKAEAQSHTLSGGMKRKLSVGVALCGGSKVVMLDEPTSGMDPSARRTLWDILEAEKTGRTILLTTHFMDEADLLGDRIAIMANGKLQCCGSSFFLKKKYGSGYQLGVAKSRDCDVDALTNLLKAHVPTTQLVQDVGSELTYCLPEEYVSKFEVMLADLEINGPSLGVQGFGVSLTTMEEVFVKAGHDGISEDEDGDENDVIRMDTMTSPEVITSIFQGQTDNGLSSDWSINNSVLVSSKEHLYDGSRLLWNQFYAMMMKKILATARSWLLYLIQTGLPIVFLIIVILVSRVIPGFTDHPPLEITLASYPQVVTVVEMGQNVSSSIEDLYDTYKEIVQPLSQLEFVPHGYDMQDYMILQGIQDLVRYRSHYVVGSTFDYNSDLRKTDITAWFSNQPHHGSPLSLNLVYNTLLQSFINENRTIKLVNDPLPFDSQSKVVRQLSGTLTKGFQYAFNIGFSMAFVSSFYVMFCVRERATKAKHLQVVSGVRGWMFWITAFIWDWFIFLGPALGIILTFAIFREEGLRTAVELARLFLVLVMFAWCVLPAVYLSSGLFTVPSNGFSRLTIVSTFLGVAMFMVVVVLKTPGLYLEDVAKMLEWIFMLFPHYNVTMSIFNLYQTYLATKVCSDVIPYCKGMEDLNQTNACCREPQQCPNGSCLDWTDNYFAWSSTGIARQLVYFSLEGFILLVLVIAMEYPPLNSVADNVIRYISARGKSRPSDEAFDFDEPEDIDVTREKEQIRSTHTTQLNEAYQLVLRDVCKRYGHLLAVKDLCLGIRQGECFGLLGINGAGKTTTFKMLTGDEDITFGEMFLSGLSLKTNMKEVHQLIGYCPQFDAVLDDLTGRETLTMFCLLRGVPWRDCNATVERLARELAFIKHIDKRVKQYSGGNKRKLSTAVALVGDPPVVLLDEPTTGMDPVARRQLWDVICRARNAGKCIVLTSHSMEECEALCTRLAIMVNGEFRCLGSPQYLKSKFAEGYTLIIKVARNTQHRDQPYELGPVKHFVNTTFRGPVLKEEVQGMMTYYIPWDPSLSWSKMFGLLEKVRKPLSIEDYSLGQTTLEQVFLTFTKSQRYVES